MLETDKGCRMAVERLEFGSLRVISGQTARLVWEWCHGKETGCVPARVLVVSFALLLVNTTK
jgi:hypothetical protein